MPKVMKLFESTIKTDKVIVSTLGNSYCVEYHINYKASTHVVENRLFDSLESAINYASMKIKAYYWERL